MRRPKKNAPALRSEATNGFTLIEILVTIGIISLLTALILPNFRQGQKAFALQRSAHQLSQDIRKIQEMAMSAKGLPAAPASFKGTYGIKIEIGSADYILFADLDNDYVFDLGEAIETVSLEKGVRIGNLSPSLPSSITFTPPDPTTNVIASAVITLSLANDDQTKTVKVNKAGLISIE